MTDAEFALLGERVRYHQRAAREAFDVLAAHFRATIDVLQEAGEAGVPTMRAMLQPAALLDLFGESMAGRAERAAEAERGEA
jgi:hypothetical protein